MKLSIITVNRNNAEGLRKTIESVVSQTFTDFEYIVIDGASTDESLKVISDKRLMINEKSDVNGIKVNCISEKDSGIYNAMNKGIKIAKGEYLLFLNSGDWLADKNVVGDFSVQNINEDLIAGDIIYSNENETKPRTFADDKDRLFLLFFQDTNMAHQATFIKKDIFLKYGLYDEKYKYVSDWKFFILTLFFKNVTYRYYHRVISYYDSTGLSAQEQSQKQLRNEREEVLNELSPLITRSFRSLVEENSQLKSHEYHYNQYIKLKKGRFSFLLKILIKLSKIFDK